MDVEKANQISRQLNELCDLKALLLHAKESVVTGKPPMKRPFEGPVLHCDELKKIAELLTCDCIMTIKKIVIEDIEKQVEKINKEIESL